MNDFVIMGGFAAVGLIVSLLWGIQSALHRLQEAAETQNQLSKKMINELEDIHNRTSKTAEILWDQSPEGRMAADKARSEWM